MLGIHSYLCPMIDTERGCWRQRAKKVILFLKLLLLLLMLVYFCLACRIAPISSGYKSPLLSLSPAFSRIRTVIPSSHIRCLQRFQSFSSLGHVHIIISHIYNQKHAFIHSRNRARRGLPRFHRLRQQHRHPSRSPGPSRRRCLYPRHSTRDRIHLRRILWT